MQIGDVQCRVVPSCRRQAKSLRALLMVCVRTSNQRKESGLYDSCFSKARYVCPAEICQDCGKHNGTQYKPSTEPSAVPLAT
jgi:hypothetical protein